MTIDEHENGEGRKETSLWEMARKECRKRREDLAKIEAKTSGQMERLFGIPLPQMQEWEQMCVYKKYELAIGLEVSPINVTQEIQRRARNHG